MLEKKEHASYRGIKLFKETRSFGVMDAPMKNYGFEYKGFLYRSQSLLSILLYIDRAILWPGASQLKDIYKGMSVGRISVTSAPPRRPNLFEMWNRHR